MCAEAGVRLLKLPYSPDMNPIEELFVEIKTCIRQQRHNHADVFEKDFRTFLEMRVEFGPCVRVLSHVTAEEDGSPTVCCQSQGDQLLTRRKLHEKWPRAPLRNQRQTTP